MHLIAAIAVILVALFLLSATDRATDMATAKPSAAMTATTKRLQFPEGFIWGTATASYQIEGASTTYREASIWDTFSSIAGRTVNNDTGDVACDHYNRVESDVEALIKGLGASHYRFSIAWPRLREAKNRRESIKFYNLLIDTLLKHNIQPVATLYHWDLPQALPDWSVDADENHELISAFEEYSRLCFEEFGDRVKLWITLNEPLCSSFVAYEVGEHAPGKGRSGIDLYKAGHNLLLAHAHSVRVYRQEFEASQGGRIGITLNSNWFEPADENDEESVKASDTAMQFELGWFAHPIFSEHGNYPPEMMSMIADGRLPQFTNDQIQLLKGSSDFFGLNHYSTMLVKGYLNKTSAVSYENDKCIDTASDSAWPTSDMGWAIVPMGFRKLLKHVHTTYKPAGGILVTENGVAVKEANEDMAVRDGDTGRSRISFYEGYLQALHQAISEDGVDVRAYFLWSLMDNFEWAFGYTKRFGLYFVDFETQERVAKPAVQWYTQVVSNNALQVVIEPR